MGVGNTYAALIYDQGVRNLDLTNVILPGAPCWDARNPGEADEINHFLHFNQQIKLEVRYRCLPKLSHKISVLSYNFRASIVKTRLC